jgi:hypothetical protein
VGPQAGLALARGGLVGHGAHPLRDRHRQRLVGLALARLSAQPVRHPQPAVRLWTVVRAIARPRSPRATRRSTSKISHIPISRYAISHALLGRGRLTDPGHRGWDQEGEKTACAVGSCR